jgi:hypothetical protein
MAIADVNHDSALDVACVGDFGVIRALTHAGGAFSEAAKSPGGFGGNSMRIADANGDGHADFLLGVHASLGPSRLTVLCGDGAGGMLGLASSPPSNPIGSLEMIDWTGDGLPDLLTTAPASLDVYVGSGSSFTPTASAPMPQGTHVPAVADFNLDGLADAVSPGANGSMGSLYLTLGNGAGGFGAVKVFPVEQGYIPYRTAAGDFNADGAPDAVSFDNYTSKVSFLPGDGNGNLAAPIPLAAPAAPWDIAAADVNVDGNLDVVASTGGSIKSFLGGPGGPVAGPMTVDTSGSFPTIGLGDSTGDGVPDVVTSGSSQSTFYVGTGSGAFVKRATFGLTTNERPRLLSVNLDERVDLVIPDADGTLIVYFGTATGFSPSAGASYLPMSFTGHTILGDFDVDGVLDAVRGSETTGEILLARGLASPPAGTGAFGSGTAGCDGGQGIRGNAPPAVGLSSFGVSCTNAPSSALGLLLYADATHAGGLDVFGIGVALHVDPFAATEFGALNLTSDAGGVAFVPVPIPNNPALHGKSFGLQGVWLWAPGRRCTPTPFGLSSTQGLSITLP